jgi:hypothetical protein
MSDGLIDVMNRISQIRTSFGRPGGTLGVKGDQTGFEQALRAASGTDARRPGTAARRGVDPLDRFAVPGGGRTVVRRPEGSPASLPTGAPDDAEPYAEDFVAASQETGVPLEILLAVAWAESGFDPNALSPAGAEGMMQLMPGTAAGLGVDPSDPAQNILGGARYLAAQYERFGSWDLALAAYNAGPGAVEQYGGVPPYRETQGYIAAVRGYLDRLTAPAAAPTGLARQALAVPVAGRDAAIAVPAVPGAEPAATDPTGAVTADRSASPAMASASTSATAEAVADLLAAARAAGPTAPATPMGTDGAAAPATASTATGADGAAADGDTAISIDAIRTGTAPSGAGGTQAGQGGPGQGAPGQGGPVPGPTRSEVRADAAAAASANATAPTAAANQVQTPLSGPGGMPMSPAAFPQHLLGHVQRSAPGTHRLDVRLDPPELGPVEVIFELRGDQVHVVVRPERAEGGALLFQQRERIAELLAREGLQLSSFDVGTGSSGPGNRGHQPAATTRGYGAVDLDLTTDPTLTADRELRL